MTITISGLIEKRIIISKLQCPNQKFHYLPITINMYLLLYHDNLFSSLSNQYISVLNLSVPLLCSYHLSLPVDNNNLILKVGHALFWHVLESKLSSFMQITEGNFPFKLTFNKVISLAKKGDNSTNDAVNLVTLALLNCKSWKDVSFRKNIFSKNVHYNYKHGKC